MAYLYDFDVAPPATWDEDIVSKSVTAFVDVNEEFAQMQIDPQEDNNDEIQINLPTPSSAPEQTASTSGVHKAPSPSKKRPDRAQADKVKAQKACSSMATFTDFSTAVTRRVADTGDSAPITRSSGKALRDIKRKRINKAGDAEPTYTQPVKTLVHTIGTRSYLEITALDFRALLCDKSTARTFSNGGQIIETKSCSVVILTDEHNAAAPILKSLTGSTLPFAAAPFSM